MASPADLKLAGSSAPSVRKMSAPAVDPTAQIKSRSRVRDRAEVFTAEREVNAMLDLVADEVATITSTFLEPACGHGNFLVAILERKLATVADRYAGHGEFAIQTLLAVASIYGIDICEENVAQARSRMFDMVVDHYWTHRNPTDRREGFDAAIGAVLTANIVVGDFLNPDDLSFVSYERGRHNTICRELHPLTSMLTSKGQLMLFSGPKSLGTVHFLELGHA